MGVPMGDSAGLEVADIVAIISWAEKVWRGGRSRNSEDVGVVVKEEWLVADLDRVAT